MENPIKMDDLGENPYFWKHPNILGTLDIANYTSPILGVASD